MKDNVVAEYVYQLEEGTKKVTITGYVRMNLQLVILEKIHGNVVMVIRDGVFQNLPVIQATLPSQLKAIGDNAFAGMQLTMARLNH